MTPRSAHMQMLRPRAFFVTLSASVALAQSTYAQVSAPTANKLATSVVTAIEQLCVPYVVDHISIDALIARRDVRKQIYYYRDHGLVKYVLDAPGNPVITFVNSTERARKCWVSMLVEQPEERDDIVHGIRINLTLPSRTTREAYSIPLPGTIGDVVEGPDNNLCVHGKNDAVIEGPSGTHVDLPRMGLIGKELSEQLKRDIEIRVDSDRYVLKSESCLNWPDRHLSSR
jgi:hypothetical protein